MTSQLQLTKQEESTIVNTDDEEEDPSIRPLRSTREKLCKLFESPKFHIAVVCLVIVDCLIVVAELITNQEHKSAIVAATLHYISITILSVFLVEVILKLFAWGLHFFHSKLEIFDAIVIVLSFVLDITFKGEDAVDLIIVLRLWRVARILNGVIIAVQTQAEHKLKKEMNLREGVEQELEKCRSYCNALEKENESLRLFLLKNNITDLPPSAVQNSNSNSNHSQNTINVTAEVNQQKPVDS